MKPSPLRTISNYPIRKIEDMDTKDLNELRTIIQISNDAVSHIGLAKSITRSPRVKTHLDYIFDCLHDITHLRESPLEFKGDVEI